MVFDLELAATYSFFSSGTVFTPVVVYGLDTLPSGMLWLMGSYYNLHAMSLLSPMQVNNHTELAMYDNLLNVNNSVSYDPVPQMQMFSLSFFCLRKFFLLHTTR